MPINMSITLQTSLVTLSPAMEETLSVPAEKTQCCDYDNKIAGIMEAILYELV